MSKFAKALKKIGLPPLPYENDNTDATLLWARQMMQQHIERTYAVTDPEGIDELKPIVLGGVEQWIHIRGRKKDNPVLLWLHGGPGSSVIGLLDAVLRPWEDYFTLVVWDQRQTGKSYYPEKDKNEPLTVQQFINDTEEIIRYLCDYLNKKKLFVLGSSWGTVLGMHMVKQHPDWLHAYIGVGQVVSSINAEKGLYERLLDHAREHNENELIAKMETIIPKLDIDCPEKEKYFAENCSFVRKELSRLAGETLMRHQSYNEVLNMLSFDRVISPHLSLTDISNSILGDEAAVFRPPYTFTKDFLKINLPKDIGSSFEVPIFFFTGSHDWQTPVSLSDQWFNEIKTSHKELVHFEESSHFVVNEEPGKFLIALVNKVLPFADSEINKRFTGASKTNNG